MDRKTSILDESAIYSKIDQTGFGERIFGLPDQCGIAWEKGLSVNIPNNFKKVENVVVSGVGGSAIGGELLSDLSHLIGGVPVTVCRDYELPRFVGRKSLVIASSYSGNTGETISAFNYAKEYGAKILALTAGGQLENIAISHGVPVVKIDYVGEPRTALGYSFITPLAILRNLNLLEHSSDLVYEAIETMRLLSMKLMPAVPTVDNPAKELATLIKDKLIIIYGGGILSGVARRWKTQFNENAKSWAVLELFPEAGHNAIAGIKWPKSISKNTCGVILNTWSLRPRLKMRYRVIKELLIETGSDCRVVDGIGYGALSQMLSIVVFGDFVSYYLAILNGENPAPVPPLDHLKNMLEGLH